MRVIDKVEFSDTLFQITFDPEHLAATFLVPGQYVVITMENQKPLYLVIASLLGEKQWRFIVRDSNPATHALKELPIGSSVAVSEAQGKGYPLTKLVDNNVILFTAGTGLAAIYSVVGEFLKNRSNFKEIILMHGSRFEADLPFRQEMLNWVKNDLQVYITLSQPSDSWAFYEGHVQDILKHEALDLSSFSSLICGPNPMIKSVTEVACACGLSKDKIFTNY